MKIKSKKSFITLWLCSMADTGKLVGTYDFLKELLPVMSDGKYNDLFYFFNNLSDLDFSSELLEYQKRELVSLDFHEEGTTTIRLLHKFSYPVSGELMENFDNLSIHFMGLLQKELDLTRFFEQNLPPGVVGTYKLENPNGIYVMDNDMSIVTDGVVSQFGEQENTYLVQDAGFSVVRRYQDEELKEMHLKYPFDDQRYISNLMEKTVNLSKKITGYDVMMRSGVVTDRNYFEKLDDAPGYRYKGF